MTGEDWSLQQTPGVHVMNSRALNHLFTKIRDEETSSKDFAFFSTRIMRLLAEEVIGTLAVTEKTVTCAGTGATFVGSTVPDKICAVSIIRAGDSLLEAFRTCSPDLSVGKILIQRDESTEEKLPRLFYCKLPPGITEMEVLLVDPMLATGGSAKMAVQCLVDAGVDPARIIFANVISCPLGLQALTAAYPSLRVITACVDLELNEDKYIVPGLGDYGDRFFNT
eukprot:CAMPEP_0185765334 /NCGR_PEP_ID=MMETSP1174-20130828/28810_1 /TAXON_ID=35687 /ORGANISM="Dictyocha speculum, Strain CCMP1381" /LENGTH=223 /DNA_ID=CAMNT_0028448401 /DNA_START=14 /DNA_END=685 /DNA_ORIENTATION=-